MFVPIQQATWPAAGEARELRFSVNAPVLLGPAGEAQPTRAALGWLPAGRDAAVRLWLRGDDTREVRGFDLPERPPGPSARAAALERAERFLGGLGFLFEPVAAPARAPETSRPAAAPARAPETSRPAAAPARAPETSRPAAAPARAHETSRTSDPGPGADPDAPPQGADVDTAVRADVRSPLFCRSGLRARAASGAPRPRGGVE